MLAPSSLLVPTPSDLIFQTWCVDAGILVNKKIKVITSPLSVGGRGLFAFSTLEEGDPVAMIPKEVIFHQNNAAAYLPSIAEEIRRSKADAGIIATLSPNQQGRKRDWIKKLWRKVIRREFNKENLQFTTLDDLWQPELTRYAIAAVEEEHPWSQWILQWKRDDPSYTLFASNAKLQDEDKINDTVHELLSMMPFLSSDYLRAALSIRLGRFDEDRTIVGLENNGKTSAIYALLGSRATQLGNLPTSIIPLHDMINHSLDPNLSIVEDEDGVKIFTTRQIHKGEELFICYTKLEEPMDELNALWALIQWGIPTQKEDILFGSTEGNI